MSTGATGGSGTQAVSFSGAAFSAVSPSVTYGPYSTPSSVAASMAALITKNSFRYGLSAKAFGSSIVYGGNASLGVVSNAIIPSGGTATTLTTNMSAEAGTAVQNACRNAPTTPAPNTRVTVVAWINGDAVMLPSGASNDLQAHFPPPSSGGPWPFFTPGYFNCLAEVTALSLKSLGDASNTSADKAYASARLLKYTGNQNPGETIDPSTFPYLTFQYRLFADYSPGKGIHATSIGYTPEPCGTPFTHVQGDAFYQNGHYTGDSNGTGSSQSGYNFLLAETRVGSTGQAGWKTLNNDQEVPWVWSVIEFDQSGLPVHYQNASPTSPTTNYQLFPTYSVYFNGSRIYSTQQGTSASFAGLPPGPSLSQAACNDG